jgi:hypothetical protein
VKLLARFFWTDASQSLRYAICIYLLKSAKMRKATLATPLYISVAWTLMISYQFFTQRAVSTVIAHINFLWPAVAEWLFPRIDTIVFIYAFAWVFLLSSAIPSIVLGKERSVLVQFFVCLTLTLAAFIIQDALTAYVNMPIDEMFNIVIAFDNPILAAVYLSIPYLLMLAIDVQSRRKRKKNEELETMTTAYLENASAEDRKNELKRKNCLP